MTFPQAAFMLVLAQGSVRLLGISADLPPAEVAVEGLPADVGSAVGKASMTDRSPHRIATRLDAQAARR